jgi:hypothetical protein
VAALTAEDLLGGAGVTHEIAIPAELLHRAEDGNKPALVVLRPLTVKDLQVIARAARDDAGLSSALMIQQALIEPELSHAQVLNLPAGLAKFLVDQVNELSGLTTSADALTEQVQAPLARACFILAREFGWTPEEVSGMTIGQILLYLQMIRTEGGPAEETAG